MNPLGRRVAWWWKPLENNNKCWCDFHTYASNFLLITSKCISATQFLKLKQSSRHITGNYHLLRFVSVWATLTLTFVDLIFGSSLMWRNSMCYCTLQCFISIFFFILSNCSLAVTFNISYPFLGLTTPHVSHRWAQKQSMRLVSLFYDDWLSR